MTVENYKAASDRILDEYRSNHGLDTNYDNDKHSQPSKFIRRVGSWTTAALIVAGSMAGIKSANAEKRTSSTPSAPTETVLPNLNTVEPPLIDDNYKKSAVNEILDYEGPTPTPMPTEKVKNIFDQWKDETFGLYKKELMDLGCDNEIVLNVCSRALSAYDNSGSVYGPRSEGDRFQNYMSRDEIYNYALTGESEYAITDKNGDFICFAVFADKKIKKRVTKDIIETFNWLDKNNASDAPESFRNCGVCCLFIGLVNPNGSSKSMYLNEQGVLWINMNSDNISKKSDEDIVKGLLDGFITEPGGVYFLQKIRALNLVEFGSIDHTEIAKEWTASLICGGLNDIKKNDTYTRLETSLLNRAATYIIPSGLSMYGSLAKRLLELMIDMDPIGFDKLTDIKEYNEMIALAKN